MSYGKTNRFVQLMRWCYECLYHRGHSYEVICTSVRIPTRDGGWRCADHYHPVGAPCRPALLMRTPYGRKTMLSFPDAHLYAACGYEVVVESVRGTAGSSGQFHPLVREGDDGVETLRWMTDQSWCNGQVVVMGMSYVGLTGWALLERQCPQVCGAILIAAPHDLAASVWYTGSLAVYDVFTWAFLMSCLTSPSSLIRKGGQLLLPWAIHQLPQSLAVPQHWPARIVNHADWYYAWVTHPDLTDRWWDQYRCSGVLQNTTVPVVLISGWQDVFLEQTLSQYHQLCSRGQPVWLVIGPWTHANLAIRASRQLTIYLLQWLAHHHDQCWRGNQFPVSVLISRDRWYHLQVFPDALPERSWWLASGDRLITAPPPPATLIVECSHPYRSYRGGRTLSIWAGRHYHRAARSCQDVLCFTSAELDTDVWIFGRGYLELDHQASVYPADVWVQVRYRSRWGLWCDLANGYRRVHQSGKSIRIDLDPLGYRLRARERLQVLLRCTYWPRYQPPPVVGSQTIRLGVSRLVLPCMTTAPPWR